MSDDKSGGFLSQLRDNPATKELLGNLGEFATAKAGSTLSGMANRLGGGKPDSPAEGAAEEVGESIAEGDSPVKTALSGMGGAIKGLFKKGGANKRPTNITDDFFIGMPVDLVYEQWTNYTEFASFMKGVQGVTQDDDDEGKTQWKAKIFLNKRDWSAEIVEQVENERIKWKTEAAKGTIDGVITFHSLGDNLTLVIYVLEYRPKGLIEWTGNRWRAVGRRARLDMKHFKRHVTMMEQEQEAEADEPEPEESQQQAEPEEESQDDAKLWDDQLDEPEEKRPESAPARRPRRRHQQRD